jgi:hypothetical protein
MLQDEADPKSILSVKRIKALEALAEYGLAFDALITPGQIETIASLARHFNWNAAASGIRVRGATALVLLDPGW